MLPVIAILVTTGSCNFPRDPEHTLDRITNGVIRVGYTVDSPWVSRGSPSPRGVEAALVNSLARSLNARVTWIEGPSEKILEAVRMRELDLAIGGYVVKSPWSKEVAFTKPYYHDEHVLAVPQGENAWLMRVEQHLAANRSRVPQYLGAVP